MYCVTLPCGCGAHVFSKGKIAPGKTRCPEAERLYAAWKAVKNEPADSEERESWRARWHAALNAVADHYEKHEEEYPPATRQRRALNSIRLQETAVPRGEAPTDG